MTIDYIPGELPEASLAELEKIVNEQAVGIKMMIDLLVQLDRRVKKLELDQSKRDRKAAKLISVNGEALAS